jgi:hypothetical protein
MFEYSSFVKNESGSGLLNYHKLGELKNKFIVQRDDIRSFMLFEDVDEYLQHESTYRYPIFHELILNGSPRKFFFDLDYKTFIKNRDEYSYKLANFNQHVEGIKKIIVQQFNRTYIAYAIMKDDILNVVSNQDINSITVFPSQVKFSMNIILSKYAFPDHTEFVNFGKLVLKAYNAINNQKKSIIDDKFFANTYTGFIQNRLIFNTKTDEMRFKYPLIDGEISHDKSKAKTYIISCVDSLELLPETLRDQSHKSKNRKYKDVTDGELKEILESTKSAWEGYTPRHNKVIDGRIEFDRVRPAYCDICCETHHKDNQLVLLIDEFGDVYKTCRHGRGYILVLKRSPDDHFERNEKNEQNERSTKTKIEWYNSLGGNVIIESKPTISETAFTDSHINLIKAEMKMGKTKSLIKYLQTYDFRKAIFISFRRTFSAESLGKYKCLNFESYSELEGCIDTDLHPRIIIQVESLHRLKLPIGENDLIILDEVESIWSQFSSSNFRDFMGSFKIFELLLKYSKRIIAMDANLSTRTANLFSKIQYKQKGLATIYINKHNPNSDYTYYVIGKDSWITKMVSAIKNNNNIAVFSNSLKEAKALRNFVAEQIGKDKVKLYGGKTKESVKRLHFQSVDDYWSRYKCVICTPTVSAGISFEKDHFDFVFGYFTDLSCDVETCRQMLGRVRNVKSREVFITLSCNNEGKYLTDTRQLLKTIQENRFSIVEKLQKDENTLSMLQFDIDPDTGNSIYEDNFHLQLILENLAFRNRSRNRFASLLIRQISGETLSVKTTVLTQLPNNSDLNTAVIKSKYAESKLQSENNDIKQIFEAKTLDADQYHEILEKSQNMIDVTKREQFELEKYHLLRILQIDPVNVTLKTIKLFNNKRDPKRLVANRELFAGESWQSSIDVIRERDAKLACTANSRSEITMVYRSAIHELMYEICTKYCKIDFLNIATKVDYLDVLSIIDSRNVLFDAIIKVLPMVDLPFDNYFVKGANPEKIDIDSYVTKIARIVNVFYGFRIRSKGNIYSVLPMEDVIYCANSQYYKNGKIAKELEADLPVVNISWITH